MESADGLKLRHTIEFLLSVQTHRHNHTQTDGSTATGMTFSLFPAAHTQSPGYSRAKLFATLFLTVFSQSTTSTASLPETSVHADKPRHSAHKWKRILIIIIIIISYYYYGYYMKFCLFQGELCLLLTWKRGLLGHASVIMALQSPQASEIFLHEGKMPSCNQGNSNGTNRIHR